MTIVHQLLFPTNIRFCDFDSALNQVFEQGCNFPLCLSTIIVVNHQSVKIGNKVKVFARSTYNLKGAKFGGGFAGTGGTQSGGTFNDYSSTDAVNTNTPAKTILILAANPTTTSRLRLDEEVREIDAGLQRAKKREQFDLKQRWAVRIQEVYQALLDFKPQFVHFSLTLLRILLVELVVLALKDGIVLIVILF